MSDDERVVRVATGFVRASYYCADHVVDLKSRYICTICGKRILRAETDTLDARGFPK